eukprot:86084-Rhodomonas_salina.3
MEDGTGTFGQRSRYRRASHSASTTAVPSSQNCHTLYPSHTTSDAQLRFHFTPPQSRHTVYITRSAGMPVHSTTHTAYHHTRPQKTKIPYHHTLSQYPCTETYIPPCSTSVPRTAYHSTMPIAVDFLPPYLWLLLKAP